MGNLRIVGDSLIPSGEFDKVSIIGDSIAKGRIKAKIIKVTGDTTFDDFVIANELKIVGNLIANSKFEVDEIARIVGDASFNGDAYIKNCKISGNSFFGKNIQGIEMKILGSCITKGNCEFENLSSKGRICVSGLLTGENIEILLVNDCEIEEIGATNIKVLNQDKNANIFFNKVYKNKLTAKLIEGDNIELSNTICDVVRGNNIIIKEGCIINRIEYKEMLNVDDKSEVGENKWMKN